MNFENKASGMYFAALDGEGERERFRETVEPIAVGKAREIEEGCADIKGGVAIRGEHVRDEVVLNAETLVGERDTSRTLFPDCSLFRPGAAGATGTSWEAKEDFLLSDVARRGDASPTDEVDACS